MFRKGCFSQIASFLFFFSFCFPSAYANDQSLAESFEKLPWETASDSQITQIIRQVSLSKSPLVFKAVLKKISSTQDRVAYLIQVLHEVNTNAGYSHTMILSSYLQNVLKNCMSRGTQLDKDKLMIILDSLNSLGPNEYKSIFDVLGGKLGGIQPSPFLEQILTICNINGAACGDPGKISWLVEKMKNDPWFFTEENFDLLKNRKSKELEEFCINRIIQDESKELSYEDSMMLDYLNSMNTTLSKQFKNVLNRRKQILPKNSDEPFDSNF
jgi:hypothetical protein